MSWTKGSRVEFKDSRIPDFLDALSVAAAEQGFNVYATSAYRSPEDQARVVCDNYINTDGANLAIYGAETQKIYREACPDDMDDLVNFEREKLARRIANDPSYQSHGTGDAVDIRIRDLTQNQRVQFKSIIESLGARVLWETEPLHFHVWLGDFMPPKKSYALWIILGLTSAGLAFFYRQKLAQMMGRKK